MPEQLRDESPASQSSVAALRDVVAKLQTDLAAAGARVDELRDARKPFAFDSSQGDAGAKRRLAQLTNEQHAAERLVSDHASALTEANMRLDAAVRADAEQHAELRLAEAKQFANELLECSAAFDAAAAAMVEALRRRAGLSDRIARTGALRSSFVNRLRLSGPVERALAAARLPEFVATLNRLNIGRASLREQDANALSALQRPAIENGTDDDEPEAIAETSEARHRPQPLIDKPAAARDDEVEFNVDDFEVNPNPSGAEPAEAA